MKHAIDAIYENGTFRPIQREVLAIAEGQRVRITVDDEGEPPALRLAMSVYDGLSDHDIREIEAIALDRGSRRMKGSASFYTFAYLRQAAWNAFGTGKTAVEGSNYHRISAVLFAALTIEAHLNHVGEFAVPDWSTIEPKLRWRQKLERVAQELSLHLDKSRRPIQTVIELFSFRDKLAHGKTHTDELEYKYVAGSASREDNLDPVWLRKYWSDDAVRRVLDDVEEVLCTIHDKAGLDRYTLNLIGDSDVAETAQ